MKPVETNFIELCSIFNAAKIYFQEMEDTESVVNIERLIKGIVENDAYEMIIIEKPF